VRRVDGYENGFIVEYVFADFIYKYYVIVQDRKGDSYSVVILDNPTQTLVEVHTARFTQSISYFGYTIRVEHANSSTVIEQIVIDFGKKITGRKFER
jgi:hypothetical protein